MAVEKKVKDIAVATYPISTVGSFTLLNGLVPGTDFNNRIGRKVFLNSFYVRGFCRNSDDGTGGSTSPGDLWRMIIFMDMQPNGSAPAVTDLLVSASSASQLNMNNRDRFKVLCDKQYTTGPWTFLGSGGYWASADGASHAIKKYKRVSAETIYNAGTAGTIADIISGALYMFWIGTSAAVEQGGEAVVSVRVRYTDY